MKRFVLVASAAVVVVIALVGLVALAPALAKLDYGRLPTRASWHLPDRVVDALDLETGAQVADLGAGDGYFTFTLADAVGAGGRVYAVDVEADIVDGLRASVTSRGYDNVEAVLGDYDDPGLPDGEIDVVFLCNVYHHIDDRVSYFSDLRRNLAPGARVAIIDIGIGGAAPLRWLSPPGHSTDVDTLVDEMAAAGYDVAASFDFLPLQNFVVFGAAE